MKSDEANSMLLVRRPATVNYFSPRPVFVRGMTRCITGILALHSSYYCSTFHTSLVCVWATGLFSICWWLH